MKTETPIYPELEIIKHEYSIVVKTRIRRKIDGKWHLTNYELLAINDPMAIGMVAKDVHRALNHNPIDAGVFYLDENQEDELDRLKKQYPEAYQP